MGSLCPFNDGRHKLKPWQERGTTRSGMACVRCSKTWEHVDRQMVATWPTLIVFPRAQP